MIIIRKSHERGLSDHDWLNSFHSFSFADYHDINHMGFKNLRVINEDKVLPGKGFGTHSHRNMEIITYVIEGAIEHKDSLGTGSIIRPGEIQKMSAGSGIEHSEFNTSKSNLLHLLQIWIIPNKLNVEPKYEQKSIATEKKNELILLGTNKDNDHAVTIHQDVELFVAYLDKDKHITYSLPENRAAWIQVIKGDIDVNHITLSAGDGAAIEDESSLTILGKTNAEFLLFDLG